MYLLEETTAWCNDCEPGHGFMEEMSFTTMAGIAGLVIGFGFGVLTQVTNYCSMGAVNDVVSFGNYNRFRALLLAIAVGMAGAQTMQFAGIID